MRSARRRGGFDRRFARARFDAVRLLREFLDEVRDGRAEPEDVSEAVALALGDPRAEVVFRLPETGAYADRLGHVLEALPEDDRARAVIGRDDRELGLLLHDPALGDRPDLLRAAIEAELAELEGPDTPPGGQLPADADLRSRLQVADRVARNAQAASLDSLQQLLRDKADKLRQQIVLRDQQLTDNRRDLEGIAELKEKGLAVNARVTALTTAINDIEAKRLDLEATLLMAEQQLNEAERDRAAIIDDARSDNLQKLAELEDDMAAAAIRLGTADRLLTQAMLAGELAPEPDAAEQPGFVVTRATDGTPERIEAAPDMALEPGDVLEITLPGASAASPRPVAAAPQPAPLGQVAAADPGLAAR